MLTSPRAARERRRWPRPVRAAKPPPLPSWIVTSWPRARSPSARATVCASMPPAKGCSTVWVEEAMKPIRSFRESDIAQGYPTVQPVRNEFGGYRRGSTTRRNDEGSDLARPTRRPRRRGARPEDRAPDRRDHPRHLDRDLRLGPA